MTHPNQPMLDAFGDAAALMVAAGRDLEGVAAALHAMSPTDLGRVAAAACMLGGTLIKKECAERYPDTEPGPVLRYLVAVSRNASDIGR